MNQNDHNRRIVEKITYFGTTVNAGLLNKHPTFCWRAPGKRVSRRVL
jgi:hypothetical protein